MAEPTGNYLCPGETCSESCEDKSCGLHAAALRRVRRGERVRQDACIPCSCEGLSAAQTCGEAMWQLR